jgi:hypothetical protein
MQFRVATNVIEEFTRLHIVTHFWSFFVAVSVQLAVSVDHRKATAAFVNRYIFADMYLPDELFATSHIFIGTIILVMSILLFVAKLYLLLGWSRPSAAQNKKKQE